MMIDPLPPGATLRAFLAIDLPAEIKEALDRIQARLKNLLGGAQRTIRWSRPASIHLTLQFFGDIPSENVDLISEVVKKNMEGFAPFMLNLGSLGAFPAVTRPRVLYLGLEGQTDRLCRLQQQIATDLQELGFEFGSERIPRGLPRGMQANQDRIPTLGIGDSPELAPVSLQKEERAFTAHLTLGRTKPGLHRPDLATAFQKIGGLPKAAFTVRVLKLFRSELRPDGPVYTVLENFPLGSD